MRGKIIQYNGNDGYGLISANGAQFNFHIRHWREETAPTVNRVVDIEVQGDAVVAVTGVPDDVLLREKAHELKEKLGGAGALLGAGGGEVGRNLLAQLGIPLAAAYAVFILASLVFGFGSFRSFSLGTDSASLYTTTDLLARNGKGGYTLFLYGAYLSCLVPAVWKHRYAAFATLIPLLLVLAVTGQIYGLYSNAHGAFENEMRSIQGMYGHLSPRISNPVGSFSDFFAFGLGFYVCLAAAVAAAGCGLRPAVTMLLRR